MRVAFSKYAGCGNDFILFDNRSRSLSGLITESIRQLCHRQQGIGADGIIFLEESDQADFKMRIFNADGTEAEMCGNGIRCLMKFIHELNLAGPLCTIETMQRRLTMRLREEDDAICVEMGNPTDVRWDISLIPSQDGYKIGSDTMTLQLLNTGVPHAILFVDEIDSFDLAKWGPKVRHHPFFSPQGTNFSVATRPVNGEMSIRTYERGVEGETLACGTGAAAAALAAAHEMQYPSPIKVRTRSNEILEIGFDFTDGLFSAVTMTGPAKRTYRGEVETS
jgi:diaminopimelate epimerase